MTTERTGSVGGVSAPPARVLHVFSTFDVGGPQRRAVELVGRWHRTTGRGVEHAVLALDGRTAAAKLWPSDVPMRLVDRPEPGKPWSRIAKIGRLLRAERPDLLCTYNWGSIEWLLAARLAGYLPRTVHHEDGFGAEEQNRLLWRRSLARRLLFRGLPAVVVPSRVLEEIAHRVWRVPAQRLRYLPNGVDLGHFTPRAPTGEGDVVFGAVGGLRPVKDQALAIRAFAAASCHRTAVLRLVGDGPDRPTLEQLARDEGVADRVVFVGNVTDPGPEYAKFDVFVISSKSEQMPLALLEAMASGLPVASTDVGDVRSMLSIQNAEQGLAPAGDVKGLASAFDHLAADAGRRTEFGRANRQRAEEQFEIGTCYGRFLRIYDEVLRGVSAGRSVDTGSGSAE